ncbi:hypothetical protein [Streptomyces sp. NPDC088757]|uniref:hypothetical protein n=1 Tax=Streptomyces sp. NPDC088757 TaxID=3365889 RepID=UPI0037F9F8E1
MSKTVPPTALCGARRPGWETGPAIGINRIPCVQDAGHDGDHVNAFGQSWPHTPKLATALLTLADKLATLRPSAAITERLVLAQALVIAVQLLGPGDAAEDAERDLLALLPAVTGQTRGQYAEELRDAAREVTR